MAPTARVSGHCFCSILQLLALTRWISWHAVCFAAQQQHQYLRDVLAAYAPLSNHGLSLHGFPVVI